MVEVADMLVATTAVVATPLDMVVVDTEEVDMEEEEEEEEVTGTEEEVVVAITIAGMTGEVEEGTMTEVEETNPEVCYIDFGTVRLTSELCC